MSKIDDMRDQLFQRLKEEGFPQEFTPCWIFHHGEVKEIPSVSLEVEESNTLKFSADWRKDTLPALPLRGWGRMENMGWDVLTVWAVDANKVCWLSDAHGYPMEKVSARKMIAVASSNSDEYTKQAMHRVLGKKKPLPEWARTALRMGWTPPDSFSLEDYDKEDR